MLNECFNAYQAGGYSPKFLNADDLEPGTIVVNEEDDTKRLEFARMQVVDSGKKVEVCKLKKLFNSLCVMKIFFVSECDNEGGVAAAKGGEERNGRGRGAVFRRTGPRQSGLPLV